MQVIYNVSYIMFHHVQDVSSLQHVGHLVQIRQHIDAAIGGYSVHVVRLVALPSVSLRELLWLRHCFYRHSIQRSATVISLSA